MSIIRRYITSKPLWVNILIAILLVAMAGFLFLKSLNFITQHGVAATVPVITGKSVAQAQALLQKEGFEVVIQDSVYYDSLPPTTIIKQIPEGGSVVKKNRTLYITINRTSPPEIEMPNLVGYSYRNVELILKNSNLVLGDTSTRPDFAVGSILEQLYRGVPIKPGTKVKWGSRIDLVIGAGVGNQEILVPNLVGLTYAEAKAVVASANLSFVSVIPMADVRDTASAYVYRQNPEAKDEKNRAFRIRAGQTMDVWLSVTPPSSGRADTAGIAPAAEQ